MSAVPDYVGPIVGWRVWLVVEEEGTFRLRSLVYNAFWPARHELVATCLRSGGRTVPAERRTARHSPPSDRCQCGIYAARELEKASSYLEGYGRSVAAVHRVIGHVRLWGQVLECEQGWRASRA